MASSPASDAADRGFPGRVALAGASGLVGQALARRLSAEPGCRALALLLRRPQPALEALPHGRRIDWDGRGEPALPALDLACCALGTTIAVAGSQAAFRAVDHEAVLAFARAARAAGARRFGVISALGADAGSKVFYNRVKGEMERDLAALGFDSLVIARPSLLLGERGALGQPERRGERWGQRLAPWINPLLPARWRPIAADTVAAGLLAALREGRPGRQIIESDALARRAAQASD